ncbi:hypothetical protein ABIB00_007771 [Bradyrhizobium sp. LB14.3]
MYALTAMVFVDMAYEELKFRAIHGKREVSVDDGVEPKRA